MPDALPRGEICGLFTRQQFHIDRLAWDRQSKRIELELTSSKKQKVTVRLSNAASLKSIRATGADVGATAGAANARELSLVKGRQAKVTVEL